LLQASDILMARFARFCLNRLQQNLGVRQQQSLSKADMSITISEVTRRGIVDSFHLQGVTWSGRLQEDHFLARVYNLASLPSTDHRFSNASGDIWQHRVRNDDWNADWVFFDSRFNLLYAPDVEFLAFLCETVHPVVRPDVDAARQLVTIYNDHLRADGWRLVETGVVSEHPLFRAVRDDAREEVFSQPTGWQKVDRQLQEARLRLETAGNEEQFQAVGLICREALISVTGAVFDPSRHPTLDGVAASETDAKRRLEAIFEKELHGSANEEARAHAKAAVKLAYALQHKRTADFRTAAICAEAASSVVNLLAILFGRRDSVP
jgi:hypothetical protein